MMPLVAVVTDDVTGCKTPSPMETNDCVGGCGTVRGWCCVPSEYVYRPTSLLCSNGTVYVSKVSPKQWLYALFSFFVYIMLQSTRAIPADVCVCVCPDEWLNLTSILKSAGSLNLLKEGVYPIAIFSSFRWSSRSKFDLDGVYVLPSAASAFYSTSLDCLDILYIMHSLFIMVCRKLSELGVDNWTVKLISHDGKFF